MRYDEMPAGLKMNQLIVEKITKGGSTFCCPRCGGTWFGTNFKDNMRVCHGPPIPCGWTGALEDAPSLYSNTDAAALELLDIRDDWWFDLSQVGPRTAKMWRVIISTDNDEHEGGADTLALAICRAVLAAAEENERVT